VNLSRASWLIVIAVVVITAAVPSLRALARRQAHGAVATRGEPDAAAQAFSDSLLRDLFGLHLQSPAVYAISWGSTPGVARNAIPFVLAQYPDDAEMLASAAFLAQGEVNDLEREQRTEEASALTEEVHGLLARAASEEASPAYWAAYAEYTLEPLRCRRIGESGVDPGDPQSVQEARRDLDEQRAEDVEWGLAEPTQVQVAEALKALREWEQADRENAMPVALRAWALYAVGRDEEAIAALRRADSLPICTSRGWERGEGVRRLALDLGCSPLEAVLQASNAWDSSSFMGKLRSLARVAVYEGRVAQLDGRPEDAIAMWTAAIDLGRRYADSSYTIIGGLVGAAVEGIGAAPVWSWQSDSVTGMPGGPLMKGRLMYGPQYEFYVEHRGQASADEIRDHLLVAKLRSRMTHDYMSTDPSYPSVLLAGYYPLISQLVATAGVPLLLLLVIPGLIGRNHRMPPAWDRQLKHLATWLLVLTSAAVAWAVVGARLFPDAPIYPGLPLSLVLLPGLLVLVGTLVLSVLAWGKSHPFGATWGASVRRITPPMLAFLAVCYLVISFGSTRHCCRLAGETAQPEMERLIAWVGPDWYNPPVPPDAWIPQHPPSQTNL